MSRVGVWRAGAGRNWLLSASFFSTSVELFDLLVVLLSGLAAEWIRFSTFDISGPRGLVLILALFVSYVVFRRIKLHDPAILGDAFTQMRRAMTGALLVFFIILAIGYATKTAEGFSRLWIGGWWLSVLCLLALSKYGVASAYRKLERSNAFQKRYVIISTASEIERVQAFLARWRRLAPASNVIEAVFVDSVENLQTGIDFPGTLIKGTVDEFAAWNEQNSIEDAIVILPPSDRLAVDRVLETLSSMALDVNIIAGEVDEIWAGREVDKIAGLPTLRIMSRPLTSGQVFTKRVVDIALSLIALVLLGPLMLLVALAIKLDSPGPVLFRQQRHGFNNKPFDVLKFRTMYHAPQVPGTVKQASRGDSRITRLGAYLRRSSMDELPQFLNVLLGDMSLVGPRPLAIEHNMQYAKVIDSYLARHRIKPGITGWAQVHGLRGETQTVEKMKKRIEYDLHYADNWSLALDFEIMLRTFGCLTHPNAY